MPRRALAPILALVAVVALSGCAALVETVRETVVPTVVPEPTPSSGAGASGASATPDVHECDGQDAFFGGENLVVRVLGTCPTVQVQGYRVDVDLTGATVYELTVSGNSNTVGAGELADLTVNGEKNSVAVTSAQRLGVYGNGNDVDATGAIPRVTIGGIDNTILAGTIGAVDEQGAGNTVRGRG